VGKREREREREREKKEREKPQIELSRLVMITIGSLCIRFRRTQMPELTQAGDNSEGAWNTSCVKGNCSNKSQ
jgi:hypothetical protein